MREENESKRAIVLSEKTGIVRGLQRRVGTFVHGHFFESTFGDHIEVETKDSQFFYIKSEDIRDIPVGTKCKANGADALVLEPTKFMNLSDNEVLVLSKGKRILMTKNQIKESK